MLVTSPYEPLFLLILLLRYLNNVSFINVDFPEPDTPVTQVINPTGISTVKFFKLFEHALCIFISFVPGLDLTSGTEISFFPDKYIPVIEFLLFLICLGVPSAMISPPYEPAPGPISIT